MLQPDNRLRRSTDLERVRRQGHSWHHPLAILLVQKNTCNVSRFAFIASRRVGKAVHRNRAKRLMREAVRLYLGRIKPGWDCVIIARATATDVTFLQMETAVSQLLRRAHLLPDEGA